MTGAELIAKVKERLDQTEPGRDPVEATGWWISYSVATDIVETWTTRDFARAIQAGQPIDGPYQSEKDIEEWCVQQAEVIGDDMPVWVAELDDDLDAFFGVKRQG